MSTGIINQINSALADYFGKYNQTLWTGSWSANNSHIDVPNTDKYIVFAIYMNNDSGATLAVKNDGKIDILRGAMLSNSNNQYIDCASFTYDGNRWTMVNKAEFSHNPGGNHGSASAITITKIVGILPIFGS